MSRVALRPLAFAVAAGAVLLGGCDRVYRYEATAPPDAAVPTDLASRDKRTDLPAVRDAPQLDALSDVPLPMLDEGLPDLQPDAPPLPFGCVKVFTDLGLLTAQKMLEDDFDAYPLDSYPPAPWGNFWSGQDAVVSDAQTFSPAQSFELSATASWARYDGVAFAAKDASRACYEVRVMTTHADKAAKVGFAWKTSSSTTGHYASVEVGGTNSPYPTGTWHHVVADVDFVANKCSYAIDGVFGVPTSCGAAADVASVTHFFVGVTNFAMDMMQPSVVYFDDVRLYAVLP